MFIYSKKIILFIHEIKRALKEVLATEAQLKVYGDRFYDRQKRYSYPIKIVVYNNKGMLGYFDSNFLELGFHESLMHSSREQLHNIIRHELAHYLTFIDHGAFVQPHGSQFRDCCLNMGWGEEVYSATMCLEGEQSLTELEESSILRKIQKLMALAASSNTNEAEQAMIKSQQLLLKHNIETRFLGGVEEEKIVVMRIMKQKRENAKMRSIARILETFFVSPIYNRIAEHTYLEIVGTAVNVEIADYVAHFLQDELEKLWDQAQMLANLKGMIAKNSFFLGIAKGYCNKIQALKREHTNEVTSALMVIEKKLADAVEMVFPRLSAMKSNGSYCATSSSLGESMGRQLNINPALKGTTGSSGTQISYSGR